MNTRGRGITSVSLAWPAIPREGDRGIRHACRPYTHEDPNSFGARWKRPPRCRLLNPWTMKIEFIQLLGVNCTGWLISLRESKVPRVCVLNFGCWLWWLDLWLLRSLGLTPLNKWRGWIDWIMVDRQIYPSVFVAPCFVREWNFNRSTSCNSKIEEPLKV